MSAEQRVYALQKESAELDNQIDEAIRAAWPCGRRIRWLKNGKTPAVGHVISHGYGARIFVENERTLAKYWIEPYHIQRAGKCWHPHQRQGERGQAYCSDCGEQIEGSLRI
jgi:hypothetical protein